MTDPTKLKPGDRVRLAGYWYRGTFVQAQGTVLSRCDPFMMVLVKSSGQWYRWPFYLEELERLPKRRKKKRGNCVSCRRGIPLAQGACWRCLARTARHFSQASDKLIARAREPLTHLAQC